MTRISFTTVTENKEEEEVDEEFEEKSSVRGVERPHPEVPGEITQETFLEDPGNFWWSLYIPCVLNTQQ